MAVRIDMHPRGLAQPALVLALLWLAAASAAEAQRMAPADAGVITAAPPPAVAPGAPRPSASEAVAPTPPAQAPAALSPPQANGATAPSDSATQQGFTPQTSPMLPPGSPPPTAVYPQQAPVYPQPYAPPPAQPGYYGSYPAEPGYPAQQPYPYAQEREPDVGARMHDGFFLRLKIGIGAGGTRYEERVLEPSTSNVKTRGLAGNFELAIGGSVIENFILHGNIVLTAMSANKTIDGVTDSSYDRLSTGMLLLGGGGTYYFMPANLYLTLVVGAGVLSESRYLDDDDEVAYADVDSGAGFGSSLSLGNEWWVGRTGEWGLGAAITGAFVTAPLRIGELTTRFKGHSITLNFSATYN